MITKNQLAHLGFVRKYKGCRYKIHNADLLKKESVLRLSNDRGLIVRGGKMFFCEHISYILESQQYPQTYFSNLWLHCGRLDIDKISFSNMKLIVEGVKNGMWPENKNKQHDGR